ncbi:MAG: carbamoyltransferase HypF [Promethearchaeati archaeon SRVP18_Atabeyarchaeia-1]
MCSLLMQRAEVLVTGVVQGVGFRPFIYRIAVKGGLTGYVRNRGDAGVEILVEGSRSDINRFVKDIRELKPPLADIYDLKASLSDIVERAYRDFAIRDSTAERQHSGSVIPPDVAICGRCASELRDPNDRRHDYFFITCTDCGPRYSTILGLPYDRPNTTMQEFEMCERCSAEYGSPADRRFHAQTIACPDCGPRVYLLEKDGCRVDCKDPVRAAGRLIEEGYVLAVKGNGGFHIATSTLRSGPLERIRRVKHRSQKPLAIMSPGTGRVRSFARVREYEESLLTSYMRPIVLLDKGEDYFLSDLVAPGLHNVGVMLPYTGLHLMLFDQVSEPAFVMTSANPPGEPIVIEDEKAVRELGGNPADYFLVHNRKIAQRCDDSVVRVTPFGTHSIIRRSRGFAPTPIQLHADAEFTTLAVGGEYNVTSCLLLKSKAFISQHIGDVEKLETYEFHRRAARHIVDLTNAKVDLVACDLHPRFATTALAREFGEEFKVDVVQVQHHHAHAASLMAEYSLPEMVGICCDGAGYGSDGNVWGGELLYCSDGGRKFERVGHLQEHPMPGADLAAVYPLRMLGGLLRGYPEVAERLLSSASRHFPHGEAEVDVVMKQLKAGRNPLTSSCGRVLDAISSLLGICYERTYEGEPAMKLESAALNGEDKLELKPELDSANIIRTDNLALAILENIGKATIQDLACSAQAYIARSLAEVALAEADRLGVGRIGFTGGVAYNNSFCSIIRRIVTSRGLKFNLHNLVPPGDGGLAFGQAVVAGYGSMM